MNKTLSRSDINKILKKSLSENELQESVIYLAPSLQAGATISLNRKQYPIHEAAMLLFIDLEPGVNWSHNCRYILVSKKSSELNIVDGQFPPATEQLQLFKKPAGVEDWMLLTDKVYTDEEAG